MQIGSQPNPFSPSILEGGGMISVGTTAVAVTFVMRTTGILITSDKTNTGLLYIGNSNVTSTGSNAITYLNAGDSISFDWDNSRNTLYVVASVASQNFWKGGFGA